MRGPTRAASRPRTMMTTSSSMSVNALRFFIRTACYSPRGGAGKNRSRHCCMPTRRSAFTLIEIMVALVITSLVALLAYGVAQVGYDARARVVGHLRDVESARAFRILLSDAMRNVRTPEGTDEPG